MSASSRPRVLVVDEALPLPADSGKRIRTFELLRRLASDFEICFVYHREGGPDADQEGHMEAAGVSLRPVDRPALRKQGVRFAYDLGRNLCLRVPYMVMAHRTRALRAEIRRTMAVWRPDLLHAEWTPLAANLPIGAGVPVCVSAHNVETLIWERYLENETGSARRAYIQAQVRKVQRFEQQTYGAVEAVTAVSDDDAERIRAWGGRNVHVVPNGVDVESFQPRPQAEVRAGELLFVGSLDWRPNQDAVTWFLDAIWPQIRRARPDARFQVVGRNAPAWLQARAADTAGVALASTVPDVRPYVARAALSIVPLRIGGGSRLKICEALAMGRPVLSTDVGAEGLHIGDGITRIDGEGPAAATVFAEATLALLADPHAALEQAARGRAEMLRAHAWDVIAPLQASVWSALATRSVEMVR